MSGLQGRKAYIKAARQAAEEIRKNIADDLLDTVKEVCPKVTGTLANGYRIEEGVGVTYIVNEVPYHDFVNDGTDKMAPRGMIETAIARIGPDAKKYQGR